jgi:hypothetical protein
MQGTTVKSWLVGVSVGTAALVLALGALLPSHAHSQAAPAPVTAADLPNGGIHSFTKHEARIRELLERSGWVSPGLSKSKFIYMVSFRSCGDCIRFEHEEFPVLHKAKIDTRVIVVARRNRSTAPERTGVGELWAKRDWKTFEAWTSIPVDAWTGEGLASGDNDPARAALVEKGRLMVDELSGLLADEGVSFAYPTLIWQGKDGHLRGCACEERQTYPFIRAELGLPQG